MCLDGIATHTPHLSACFDLFARCRLVMRLDLVIRLVCLAFFATTCDWGQSRLMARDRLEIKIQNRSVASTGVWATMQPLLLVRLTIPRRRYTWKQRLARDGLQMM